MSASTVLLEDLDRSVERDPALWKSLRGTRVFVTGGSGFAASLLEAFAWANQHLQLRATLVVLTRDPARFAARHPWLAADAAIDVLAGDVVDFTPPPGHFDIAIHAATEAAHPPDAERPLAFFDRDVAATRHVLEFARRAGVRRALFLSSGAVYGAQPPDVLQLREEFAGAPVTTDPTAVYAHGKRVSEFMWTMYGRQYGFDATIARLFAFVGPHVPLGAGYAVGDFIGDVLAGRSVRVAGDGTALRSYLYTADLAFWLWTIAMRGAGGCAYNVGSSEAISIAELAQRVVAATVPATTIDIARRATANAPPSRYLPAVDRARDELGLRAFTSLTEGIRRTYRWHRDGEAARSPFTPQRTLQRT